MVVVEPVRVEPLGTGPRVQVQLTASEPLPLLQKPVEERSGVPLAPRVGNGGEVVDVEVVTPRQAVGDAKAGHCCRLLSTGQEGTEEPVARGAEHMIDM